MSSPCSSQTRTHPASRGWHAPLPQMLICSAHNSGHIGKMARRMSCTAAFPGRAGPWHPNLTPPHTHADCTYYSSTSLPHTPMQIVLATPQPHSPTHATPQPHSPTHPCRLYADLVAGKLEDGALKALFRSLPKKRAAERRRLQANLQAAQPQWLLMLRCAALLVHTKATQQEWNTFDSSKRAHS